MVVYRNQRTKPFPYEAVALHDTGENKPTKWQRWMRYPIVVISIIIIVPYSCTRRGPPRATFYYRNQATLP